MLILYDNTFSLSKCLEIINEFVVFRLLSNPPSPDLNQMFSNTYGEYSNICSDVFGQTVRSCEAEKQTRRREQAQSLEAVPATVADLSYLVACSWPPARPNFVVYRKFQRFSLPKRRNPGASSV